MIRDKYRFLRYRYQETRQSSSKYLISSVKRDGACDTTRSFDTFERWLQCKHKFGTNFSVRKSLHLSFRRAEKEKTPAATQSKCCPCAGDNVKQMPAIRYVRCKWTCPYEQTRSKEEKNVQVFNKCAIRFLLLTQAAVYEHSLRHSHRAGHVRHLWLIARVDGLRVAGGIGQRARNHWFS